MGNCQFYEVIHKTLESEELSPDRRSAKLIYLNMRWCRHSQSTVTKRDAESINPSNRLKCAGDVTKCQLPEGVTP